MNTLFKLPETDFCFAAVALLFGIAIAAPIIAIVLSRPAKERTLTLQERYPDEHLGI